MNIIKCDGLNVVEHSTYCSINSLYNTSLQTINIPLEVIGKKVTDIDKEAFLNNQLIEAVNIEKNIHNIDVRAFAGCTQLKYLFVKPGYEITTIQNEAFSGCSLLTGLTCLKPTILHEYSFVNCRNVRSIDGNFIKIANGAFENCYSLHTVNLHSQVHIDEHAFENCKNLTNIYIIKDIKGSAKFLERLNSKTVVHCRADSKLANLAYSGYKIVADIT